MKNLILTLVLAISFSASAQDHIYADLFGYDAYVPYIDNAESGVKTFTDYGPAIIYRTQEDRVIPSDIKFVYDECYELLYQLGIDESDLIEDNSSFEIEDFGADGEYPWLALRTGNGMVHRIWKKPTENGKSVLVILIMDSEEISLQSFETRE